MKKDVVVKSIFKGKQADFEIFKKHIELMVKLEKERKNGGKKKTKSRHLLPALKRG